MKKVIVIRGPLGVGKSTVSRILAEKLKAEYFSLDKILKDYNLEDSGGISLENFLKGNKLIVELVSKNENVCIVDGCFYYQEQIDDLEKKFGDKIIIFSLLSSIEKCIERDLKREIVYGEDAARYVYMMTTRLQAGHEIDTNDLTVEQAVEKIMKELQ